MKRRRNRIVLVLLALAVGGGAVAYHKLLRWKRFETVVPGVLYRSGILRDWQLRRAIDQQGIRTVFSFTFTNDETERQTCRELGVQRYFCYLPGDGEGPDDPYLKFLDVVADPANHPVLVHCSAGVQRTGGAVALYRVLVDGWSFDEAIAEMIQKGNDGERGQIDQLRRLTRRLAPIARNRTDAPVAR